MRRIVIREVRGSVLIVGGRHFTKIPTHMVVKGVPDLQLVRIAPHPVDHTLPFVDLAWIAPTDISRERARP